jgi:hypothetical protein
MDLNKLFESKNRKGSDYQPGEQKVDVIIAVRGEKFQGEDKPKPVLDLVDMNGRATKSIVLNRTNAVAIAKVGGTETDSWRGLKIVTIALPVTFQGKETTAVRVVACERVAPVPASTTQVVGQSKITTEEPVKIPVQQVVVQTPQGPVVHQPQTGPAVPYQANEVAPPGDVEMKFFNDILQQKG